MQDIQKKLVEIFGQENVSAGELMSKHTTFRIGGPADIYVTPKTKEQLAQAVVWLKETGVVFEIIGNGSNLLVSDKGFDGVIFDMSRHFNSYSFLHDACNCAADKNNRVYVSAQSGIMLSRFGKDMAKNSLSGFEFATGIPGTIGGAVMMNAGAYGGEMKDVLINATVMDSQGSIKTLSNEQLKLGYRTSIIDKAGYIVLEAVIALTPGSQTEIEERIADFAYRRRDKQPLEYPSAGSTFKRPEGYFAGKLISDAGLKGFSVGKAQVSEKHAGFVINRGGATAADVIALTDYVKDKVKELYGVELELEVRKLGF
ncbi:MAG: UDP-N-acetylmuramate dehydrogenase [Eubacteriales bacterium]|nr:UDP-N-acetylmuramate dehydrogenase [Eubacteriales bacterium]